MTPTLRPMSLGEILDRSLHVYRRQFWAFITVAAVPALVVQGISIADVFWFHLYTSATRDNHWTPGIYMTQAVFAIGYYHFASFVGFLLFPVILKLVAGLVLNEEIKIRDCWRFFGLRWRGYLWLATLKLAAGLVIVEALTIALFASTMEALDALGAKSFLESTPSLLIMGFWFSAGFTAFLWIGSALSLAIPSSALENLKGWAALRRSWGLTRGSRLRIALAWVTVAIATWMLSVSAQWLLRIIFIAIVRSTHARWIAYTLYPTLSHTLHTAVTALLGPIFSIALTLFYYDQRIRHEGFDIEQMMTAAGLNPTAAASAPAMATPLPAPAPHPLAHEDRA